MTDEIVSCEKCGTKNYAGEDCPQCARIKLLESRPFRCSVLSDRSRENMEWMDMQRLRGVRKKNCTPIPEYMRKSLSAWSPGDSKKE